MKPTIVLVHGAESASWDAGAHRRLEIAGGSQTVSALHSEPVAHPILDAAVLRTAA